ncbi:MAG TPA: hypothetical protein VG013_40665 [Gemmataceae bacterium]|jgi:hypothetical protein|nr:hypothetical protein [Gemmataceae bacterium]
MADEHPDTPSPDQRVDEVIAEYLAAVEAGQAPDPQEVLARHPEMAAELAALFANREHFERLAEDLGPAARPAPAGEPTGAELPTPPQDPTTETWPVTVHYFGDDELLGGIAHGR